MATLASNTFLLAEIGERSLSNASRSWITPLLLACLAVCAGLQLHLAWVQSVNWDEFRFLSDVYALERGDLGLAVQTFHTHFFLWLTGSFGNEIDQIVAARHIMLAFEAATAGLVYAICRRFVAKPPALLAVLAFISFGFVLRHGASFRYDPIVTTLSMAAVYLLISPRLDRTRAMVAGSLTAVAALVTMKSVFFVPLLGAIALFRLLDSPDRKRMVADLALGGVSCLIVFAGLYLLHSSVVTMVDDSGAIVAQSASKTLGQTTLFPRWTFLVSSVLASPIQWVLLAVGIGTAAHRATTAPRGSRTVAWLPLAFLVPLATVAVYRNAFPYFYAFMLAPASLLIAIAVSKRDIQRWTAGLALALTASATASYLLVDRDVLGTQRATVAAVHEIFQTPVAGIDRSSMLASFPQAGFFMSTWGMENYHAAGRPVMRSAFAERGAVFLIDNSPWLQSALRNEPIEGGLLSEDAATLRENLVHHWGPIWVAGKTLELDQKPRMFEILVSGKYTLEIIDRPVMIDGRSRKNGDVIMLEAGPHRTFVQEGIEHLVLRWGDHLHRPTQNAPSGSMFTQL